MERLLNVSYQCKDYKYPLTYNFILCGDSKASLNPEFEPLSQATAPSTTGTYTNYGVENQFVVAEYRVRKHLWSLKVRSKERGSGGATIHVACVQETRWKGQKAKGLKGYKLWYAGLEGRRNGVGILVSNDILKQLVEVRRCNEKIMLVRIVVREEIISIVSAYGPQAGLDEQVKCKFWDNQGDLMRTIPEDEKVFIGGDFNGHIGKDAGNHNLVHGGFGLGARNENGENLLEFVLAKELVIANSIFRKKDEHLITYKRRMSTQHRLLVLIFRMRKKIVEKNVESRGKIMWRRLKGDMVTILSSKISLLASQVS
ncbi:uncharacterized protein LOC130798724 [Amaranthus tricolor]|uniref:uncharacterized protein LOC130798724 n=1 Tax=Amaranthus tricolor TaxID=29722 RepID=UPI00258BBFA6|nr:uncharacterized protein LOC130798724 [Amaranthus tricolor]